MPRYDYRCRECGHTGTDDVPVADRDMPHVCGECGGDMRRLFAATPIQRMAARH